MINGSIKYTFKPNRTRQILYGILFPIAGIGLIGTALVQFMVIGGWLKLSGFSSVDPGSAFAGMAAALVEMIAGCAFLASGIYAFVSLCRGLPVLIIRVDGLERKTVWSTSWAHWSSILPFDSIKQWSGRTGGYARITRAQLIGDNVSPDLVGKRFFNLENVYEDKIAKIAEQINVAQSAYFAEYPNEQKSLRVGAT